MLRAQPSPVNAPTQSASMAQSTPEMPSLQPPTFQLQASSVGAPGGGGGGGKNKAPIPSNDHPVGPEAYAAARPKILPDAVIHQIEQKIEGIEHLEICADVVIVHSPCYSAELYTIMSMVNDGSMDFATGKKAILDRLAYLLTNQFKNAEGQPNTWAQDNLQGTTVDNAANMGADWYRIGEGGPKYVALTDWRDPKNPAEGGDQYNIFKMNPPVEGAQDQGPVFTQPFGNPMTSRDADGQNGNDKKADETGNPIDITWLQRLLDFFSRPTSKAKKFRKKVKDIKDTSYKMEEAVEHDLEDKKEKDGHKAAEKLSLEEQKGRNTRIEWKSYTPMGKQSWTQGGVLIKRLLEAVRRRPENRYEILNVTPNDVQKPSFSKQEIEQYVEKEKAKH